MKWYFCMETVGLIRYAPLIQAAVISCRQHTSLTPICLWYDVDNRLPDYMAAFFARYEVTVIFQQARVYKAALERGFDVSHHTSGIFLRFEVPHIEQEDEYVLYTDCDIMFQNEVSLDHLRPRFFAAGPEFYPDYWGYFNSGVMLMNIPEMRRTSDHLFATTMARMAAGFGTGHDQGDLNAFYFEQWERLPLEYNWKPYWGVNDRAVVLHFHGPKPMDLYLISTGQKKDERASKMIGLNLEAFKHYAMEFINCLSHAGYECPLG